MVRSARLGLVAVVAVLGAGGCSGGNSEAEPPRVASIIAPSAAVSASASAAAVERPRQRLDETEADYQALIKPYQKCMKGQGLTHEKEYSGWSSGDSTPKKQSDAQKACEMFWPLPAWERDPANPEAKDFTRAVVKCLKGKGVRYVEASDDGVGVELGGDGNDAESITKGMELSAGCEREVAARN